jgi:hypothetical protein
LLLLHPSQISQISLVLLILDVLVRLYCRYLGVHRVLSSIDISSEETAKLGVFGEEAGCVWGVVAGS